MTSHYVWSVVPSDNDDADANINWIENQPPDTVNNSARQMMARGAEWRRDMSEVRVSTGAANTYAITITSTPVALTEGMMFAFRAHQTNTGAATLTVNAFAAKPLRSISGTDIGPGGIIAGNIILAFYDVINDQFLIPYANGVQQGGSAFFADGFFGTDDATSGSVTIYGGNVGDEGGQLRIHNAADHSSPVDYWDLVPDANGGFSIKRSNSATPDITIATTGAITIPNGIEGGINITGNVSITGTLGAAATTVTDLTTSGTVTLGGLGTGGLAVVNDVVQITPTELPVGFQQTWKAKTPPGDDFIATQNTTGRSIMVFAEDETFSSAVLYAEVSATGSGYVRVGTFGRNAVDNQGDFAAIVNSVCFVVPAGHWWRFSSTVTRLSILDDT